MDCAKLRILLVEDHAIAQKMAVFAISTLGCTIDVANTGALAIHQFKENKYDFIFMDLGLPDTDGYTVTETIRELEQKGSRTSIVALTAHNDTKFRQNAINAGMDDFVSKPITADKAKEIIIRYALSVNNEDIN